LDRFSPRASHVRHKYVQPSHYNRSHGAVLVLYCTGSIDKAQ